VLCCQGFLTACTEANNFPLVAAAADDDDNNNNNNNGDWLFALLIASCGLTLDNEAVRVAMGLRLGLDLCEPHQCQCSDAVDTRGLHSFLCKRAPGRSARHHALDDLVARSLAAAGVPVTKEPAELSRTDGKRPDGLTLVPWQSGKSLCWDVTVICPLAESYVSGAAREAGAAAEVAATRKEEKYAKIDSRYLFEPIETFQHLSQQPVEADWLEDFSEHREIKGDQFLIPAHFSASAAL